MCPHCVLMVVLLTLSGIPVVGAVFWRLRVWLGELRKAHAEKEKAQFYLDKQKRTTASERRERFRQELRCTSNWGLRRIGMGPRGAGVGVQDMKRAEEITGPEAVVELIMAKFDAGWRPCGWESADQS